VRFAGLWWVCLSILPLSLAGGDARADVPAPRLVARLQTRTGNHPLADETGRIPLTMPLPPGSVAADFGLSPVAPGIGAIRLRPEQLDAFAASHPGLSPHVTPALHPLLDVSGTWTLATAYRNATCEAGKGVVVGVIDTGLDLRHADFRDVYGHTRVAWMLKSGAPRGKYPELEKQFGCTDPDQSECAVLDSTMIDEMIAKDDDSLPHDAQGHGTHVTSIAAGNGGVMRFAMPRKLGGDCRLERDGTSCDEGECRPLGCRQVCTHRCKSSKFCPAGTYCGTVDDEKICIPRQPAYVGIAPEATIVVAAPSSGVGFRDPDILHAASFVFDRADAIGMPAVINLSVGGDFGPHDGTSDLEKGLAALVGDDKPGRAIVVAAGNSGALYQQGDVGPLGVHTEAHVSAYGTTRVPILAPGAKSGQGFVWITFRKGDHVSVGLEGPGGETWVGLVDPGDDGGYEDNGITGAVINALANGKSPITADTNSAVVSWDGKWPDPSEFAVLLRGEGDAQLWVVGQGDVALGPTVGLQFERGIRQGTINVPASHPGLLAVGCTVNRVEWKPLKGDPLALSSFGPDDAPTPDGICYFSSAGPTPLGLPKPEISAPGGFVAAAMSEDADPRKNPGGLFDAPGCPEGSEHCYVVDDYHAITAGSSMSAPHVAGAIALLMQKDPTLTQARATQVLQAGARYPSHTIPYDYQLGPGELDVVGAAAALPDNEAESSIKPDVTKSWYVLSSGYARPDPTWPVWGTIELRRSDGSIASGLDGTLLAISVHNGQVYQPVTKVRHGLFQFALTASPGTSGKELGLDVTYAGQSLGARTLPIGTDAWSGRQDLDAGSGACSCRQAGEGSSDRGGLGFAVVAGAGLWFRRRRVKH